MELRNGSRKKCHSYGWPELITVWPTGSLLTSCGGSIRDVISVMDPPRDVSCLSSPLVDGTTVLTPFISGHLPSVGRTTALTRP